MTSVVDETLTEMMSAVFADYRKRQDGPPRYDAALWKQLSDLGLARLTGGEESGGSGATWFEAAELLSTAAYHGVRVPLAEHDLLGCWLLESLGLPCGEARRTVCVLDEAGKASRVPWAAQADRVVVAWQDGETFLVADAGVHELQIVPGTNLAGEPRDELTADTAALASVAVPETAIKTLFLRGALARSLQVCGALDRILELTVAHARDRAQFGRPLAKFQAVQHLVADIGAETALARAATDAALRAAVRNGWDDPQLEFHIAVARSCTGHAASVAVRNAHQVHGAIGTTREHRLHEFTAAALAWRSEFGSTHHWDGVLTDLALTAGRGDLWPLISA
jgi:acyl-CoA dehydrogenase